MVTMLLVLKLFKLKFLLNIFFETELAFFCVCSVKFCSSPQGQVTYLKTAIFTGRFIDLTSYLAITLIAGHKIKKCCQVFHNYQNVEIAGL